MVLNNLFRFHDGNFWKQNWGNQRNCLTKKKLKCRHWFGTHFIVLSACIYIYDIYYFFNGIIVYMRGSERCIYI